MGSPFVFFFYTCIIMNSSINFNYKLLLVTVKIGYEFSSRVLSSEFQSIKSFISKFFPKYFFCIGHLSSETVRPFENLSRCSVCQIIYMFFHSEDGVPLSLRRGVRGEAKILFVKFPSAAAHELFCFPLPGLRFHDGQYTLAAHLSDKEKRCGANIPRLPCYAVLPAPIKILLLFYIFPGPLRIVFSERDTFARCGSKQPHPASPLPSPKEREESPKKY